MKIQYSFHEEKRLCCGKENQHRARFNFPAINLPFTLSGCGKTKQEAKKKLLKVIKQQKGWMANAIQKQIEKDANSSQRF